MPDNRHTKVLKLHILKPAGDMSWKELSTLLRDARYRVFRLANLAASEAYLAFHKYRQGDTEYRAPTPGKLNRRLRKMLDEETQARESNGTGSERFSKEGALPATVVDALSQYKLRALLSRSKWSEVARGQSALPTFRLTMPIPIRCDKPEHKRLQKAENGDVEIDLMTCLKPYPRVVIATARNSLSGGQRAILDRLIENPENKMEGYRQRCFEVKQDVRNKKWYLLVTYDFPASEKALSEEKVVGIDLGFSCPLYAAINNGHARLGRRQFAALSHRIRTLQRQVINRRRAIQRGGNQVTGYISARSGHGRKRKLSPIEGLQGRIDRAYTTLNHQLSASVIKFALNHGAGIIQMEDLSGLSNALTGSFLGERWRYEELQRFIEYKADENGLAVKKIDPRYTSRRCSECGFIHAEFDRAARDKDGAKGRSARFICPQCEHQADADYNAARNIATLDIETIIADTAKDQGLKEKKQDL